MKRKIAAILIGVIGVVAGVTLFNGTAAPASARAAALPEMCSGRAAQNLLITARTNGVPGKVPEFTLEVWTDASGKATGLMILGSGGDRLEVTDWCRVWQHIVGQKEGGNCGEGYPAGAVTAHAVGLIKRPDGTLLVRVDIRKLADGRMLFRVRYRSFTAEEGVSEGDSCEDGNWTRVPAEGWAPLDQMHVATVVRARPVASTAEASLVTATGAVLNGTVVPHNAATSYYFDYGITAAYGARVPSGNAAVGSDDSTHPVAHAIGGLQPNRTYHFRLVAANAIGTSYGADRVFRTRATPVARTGEATSLSTMGAVLNGTVNPENLASDYYFEFGPTAAYGARVPVGNAPVGSDHAEHAVAEALSGLAPDTTYHFRLVAVNAVGSSYGADAVFTTPGSCISQNLTGAFSVGFSSGFNTEWKTSYSNRPNSVYNLGYNAGYRAARAGPTPRPAFTARRSNAIRAAARTTLALAAGQSSCSSDYNQAFNQGFTGGFQSGFNTAWRGAFSSSPDSAYNRGFRAGYRSGRR